MYDQNSPNENNTYHYSYTPQHSDPWDAPQSPSAPPRGPKKKKKGGAGKVVALVLCCALVGGGAGVGGAAAYHSFTAASAPAGTAAPDRQKDEDDKEDQDSASGIQRNDTDPAPVQVKQADGLKPMSLMEINAAYADSCVCITVQATVQQGYYQYQTSGAGSGFIISADGYIVTNYHVIDGANAIKVTLNNGDSYDATFVGGEELNDVAVLKIDGVSGLKPVVLGDSDDLVVGETVCTIGNALGTLSFSMTSGAVSSIGRSITMSDGTVMNNMIQTDCTINSGNSGGPLFDSYGRVAGITSAKLSNNGQSSQATIEGVGFAIPINDVINIITDYMRYGYVTGRPYMGVVNPRDVSEQNMQYFGWPAGVYVNGVEEGSCAERAGIRQGDIITKIDDTDIVSVAQLTSVKNTYRAGDTVNVGLFRAGETLTVRLTFDEQRQDSDDQGQAQDPAPQPTSGGGGSSDHYYDPFNDFPWGDFFGW